MFNLEIKSIVRCTMSIVEQRSEKCMKKHNDFVWEHLMVRYKLTIHTTEVFLRQSTRVKVIRISILYDKLQIAASICVYLNDATVVHWFYVNDWLLYIFNHNRIQKVLKICQKLIFIHLHDRHSKLLIFKYLKKKHINWTLVVNNHCYSSQMIKKNDTIIDLISSLIIKLIKLLQKTNKHIQIYLYQTRCGFFFAHKILY